MKSLSRVSWVGLVFVHYGYPSFNLNIIEEKEDQLLSTSREIFRIQFCENKDIFKHVLFLVNLFWAWGTIHDKIH